MVRLQPAVKDDAPSAYEVLFRIGHRSLPTLDRFSESFNLGVSANFLILDQENDAVVGISSLSDLSAAGNLEAQVHLAAGAPVERVRDAYALTTNFAFAMWRTRKIYFHTTENDPEDLGFGDLRPDLVTTEAVLPDHWYFHGRLWDVHVRSVRREQWDSHGAELISQIV